MHVYWDLIQVTVFKVATSGGDSIRTYMLVSGDILHKFHIRSFSVVYVVIVAIIEWWTMKCGRYMKVRYTY